MTMVGCRIAANGSGLCEVGELEAETFNFEQMFDRSTDLEFSR